MQRFRYSPWDGSQNVPNLDAYEILDELGDDLLYSGDADAALRRMMRQGFSGDFDIEGLGSMLERLEELRAEMLQNSDLGGVLGEVSSELAEIVEMERKEMDRQTTAAAESGEPDWLADAERRFFEKRSQLDLLPPDMAGQVKALKDYDFTSKEASERFDDLLGRLSEQILGGVFEDIAGSMQSLTAADMEAMKNMMADLNEMLEARQRGEEPAFDEFMEKHGQFFPETPQNLDELLEVMARRMAAMTALMNSLSPSQRQQLAELSEALLEDMDLRWQMDQLSSNLQAAFPDLGWSQRYSPSGVDPLDIGAAMEMMAQLGDIDQLENLLRSASSPAQLGEVDLDVVKNLLGEDSAASLSKLTELTAQLEEAGLVDRKEGG